MEIKLWRDCTISVALFILISSCVVHSVAQLNRKKSSLTMEQICEKFSKPVDASREFYTPMFPEKYPNKTDCILKITAPFGYLIRLDFRDYFDLEESTTCDNDFLEIRDGPHGYSDLMGKYCGSTFPPIITSKDRNLWLRFYSDESLQYKGFRAVFDFIKNTRHNRPEMDECKFELNGSHGQISHTNITKQAFNYSKTYSVPVDCIWYIEVLPTQKIYLYFESFNLEAPNECISNYVDIFGSKLDLDSRIRHYCGSLADYVESTENKMYFRFFANARTTKAEFVAHYTAYRLKGDNNNCKDNEYYCDDDTCIDIILKCDDVKNCKHANDEEGCNAGTNKKFDISSEHIIIILTLGCGLLAGMCFAMCFNCIKKLVRDGRQIHENIRRSREQLEDRRSTSMGSSPQLLNIGQVVDEETYNQGKKNGHTCIQDEDDEDTEEECTEDEEEDDLCVEMRDCECQTRDSIASQRDSGLNGTPPPPPPPTRRPPVPPNSPPLNVPTPPPPPGYYDRHRHPPHGEVYGTSSSYNPRQPHPSRALYEVDDSSSDPYKSQHRSETLIQMRDRPSRYESSKSEKTTPDVLVTH